MSEKIRQPMDQVYPTISIITVCYNAAKTIEQTLRSVLEQTYPQVEYILVDGASSDDTVALIARYAPLFRQKGFSMEWTSEPDQGIYDAMNKGIRRATGEWINFMNAGDCFYDKTVLARLFGGARISPDCCILYGDTVLRLAFGKVEMRPKPLDYLRKKMAFCHQSTFVRTEEMRRHPFNTHYRLAADYDFFYHCYLAHKGFQYDPAPIAIFEAETGASSAHRLQVNREYAEIKGIDGTIGWKIGYLFKYIAVKAKTFFYACLPDAYVKELRRKNYERLKRRRMA